MKMLLVLETCSYRQSWSFTESTVTIAPSLASSSERKRGRHLKIKGASLLQIKAALEISVLMCFSVLFSRITCLGTGERGQTQSYTSGQETYREADEKECTLPARRQGTLKGQSCTWTILCSNSPVRYVTPPHMGKKLEVLFLEDVLPGKNT